jgi:hypothetical protein
MAEPEGPAPSPTSVPLGGRLETGGVVMYDGVVCRREGLRGLEERIRDITRPAMSDMLPLAHTSKTRCMVLESSAYSSARMMVLRGIAAYESERSARGGKWEPPDASIEGEHAWRIGSGICVRVSCAANNGDVTAPRVRITQTHADNDGTLPAVDMMSRQEYEREQAELEEETGEMLTGGTVHAAPGVGTRGYGGGGVGRKKRRT